MKVYRNYEFMKFCKMKNLQNLGIEILNYDKF